MAVRIGRRERARGEGWFHPPRLRTLAQEGDRHASRLELFFDLVFVVAITELARVLVEDHSTVAFVRFAALFVPVYVAWQGFMAYATRFDTDDLGFRAAYFAAMLAIAALAVQLDDVAHGTHTAGFALAYVSLRSILLLLDARAWRSVSDAQPLVRFYGPAGERRAPGLDRVGGRVLVRAHTAALLLIVLLAVRGALPGVAVAGILSCLLVAVVYAERTLAPGLSPRTGDA